MSDPENTRAPDAPESSLPPAAAPDDRAAAADSGVEAAPAEAPPAAAEGSSPFQPAEPAPGEAAAGGDRAGRRDWRAPLAGRPRRSTAWVPLAAAGCGGILVLAVIALAIAASVGRAPALTGDKVGLVSIEGMITGGRGGTGLFGGASGSDSVVAQLARGRRDASIKAVVVRINSPGGSAAASQEIYAELMKIRKAGKPVVASMGDVAASGGYYVAAAADRIVANGSTLTGSIGVVMEMQNLQGLFQKIGVRSNTIKSGKFKDIGSSTRPMTPEERELLQGLVNDVYEQFVGAIIAGRKQVDPARLRQLADGRIFTGRQAHALKLVDELGNLQDAVATAARLAGIRGRPTVVELRRTSLLDTLTGGEPGVGSDLRLPVGAAEEERLVRALRRLMYEQAVPR